AAGAKGSIYAERGGSLVVIARAGDHAPGTSFGTTFQALDASPVINASGRVAFAASLSGPGVTQNANDRGIWAETDAGLALIARTGDPYDVTKDDRRTISSLSFIGGSGQQDGRPSGFNDAGQVAFASSFADGSSGVFIADHGVTSMSHGICGLGAPLAMTFPGPLLLVAKRGHRRKPRRSQRHL